MNGWKEPNLNKTGEDTLSTQLYINSSTAFPAVIFRGNDEEKGAVLRLNANTKTFGVYVYPDDTSSYYDGFSLPAVGSGLTANTWYPIITTKNAYQAFPVGSCFTTTTNTNPSTLLGGAAGR